MVAECSLVVDKLEMCGGSVSLQAGLTSSEYKNSHSDHRYLNTETSVVELMMSLTEKLIGLTDIGYCLL